MTIPVLKEHQLKYCFAETYNALLTYFKYFAFSNVDQFIPFKQKVPEAKFRSFLQKKAYCWDSNEGAGKVCSLSAVNCFKNLLVQKCSKTLLALYLCVVLCICHNCIEFSISKLISELLLFHLLHPVPAMLISLKIFRNN